MPTVPRYNQQVQEQPFPSARVSAEAPAGAFGAGISGVTDAAGGVMGGLSDYARHTFDTANNLRVEQANSELTRKRNDLLWDPNSGAMTRKGQNAFGINEEFGKMFDDHAREIEKGLANDIQRAGFRAKAGSQKNEFGETLDKHTFKETMEYAQNTWKANAETAQDDAIFNYMQPGKIQQSLEAQRVAITTAGNSQGKDQAEIDLDYRKAESRTHFGVIHRMLANEQEHAAKAYYDEFKDGLMDPELSRVENAIKESGFNGNAVREANRLIAKYPDNLSAQMNATDGIDDDKFRKAVKSEIDSKFTVRKRSEDAFSDAKFQSASVFVETNRKLPDALTMNGLRPHEPEYLRAKLENIQKGVAPPKNSADYYRLEQMSSHPETRQKFLATNLLDYQNTIDPAQLSELIKTQRDVRRGDEKTLVNLDGIRSKNDLVEGQLLESGINPNSKSKDEVAKVNRFKTMVDEQVVLSQQKTGKKLNNAEIQEISSNLMTQIYTNENGWLWDSKVKKRVYQLDPGQQFEISIKDIPRGERLKIESALRQLNRPVTEPSIIQFYNEKLNRGR